MGAKSTRFASALALALFLSAAAVGAMENAASASALFDRGVREFSEGRYEAAARTFIRADDLVPSSRTLINAITAAQRAKAHALAATAATRLLAREGVEPDATALATDALAASAARVAKVTIDCSPSPCALEIDGEPATTGERYVAPGTLRLTAKWTDGSTASRDQRVGEGRAYRVRLEPPRTEDAADLPTPTHESGRREVEPSVVRPAPAPGSRKPLTPAVFVTAAVATGGLLSIAVWSGFDALAARNAFGTDSYDAAEVRRKARRTDYLWLATGLVGGATAAAGLWLVDWTGDGSSIAISIQGAGGIAIETAGHF